MKSAPEVEVSDVQIRESTVLPDAVLRGVTGGGVEDVEVAVPELDVFVHRWPTFAQGGVGVGKGELYDVRASAGRSPVGDDVRNIVGVDPLGIGVVRAIAVAVGVHEILPFGIGVREYDVSLERTPAIDLVVPVFAHIVRVDEVVWVPKLIVAGGAVVDIQRVHSGLVSGTSSRAE